MKTLLLSVLLLASPAFAGFTVPAVNNPVNDYSNVLTPAGKEQIATQIVKLKQETKAQLGVLIVDTLDGDSLEESSMNVAKAWRLGNKADSDGILLFVVVKDRKMRIEVGQGLEGTVTDARSKQILGSMKSFLRSKNFNGAILAGVEGISSTIKAGAQDIQHNNVTPSPTSSESSFPWLLVFLGLGVVGMIIYFIKYASDQAEREREADREANRQYSEDLARHNSYLANMERQGKTAHKPAPTKPRESDDDGFLAGALIGSSFGSSSSSSSSSGSDDSSSSSGSDWGGGGGDFSGGGSSDSW